MQSHLKVCVAEVSLVYQKEKNITAFCSAVVYISNSLYQWNGSLCI